MCPQVFSCRWSLALRGSFWFRGSLTALLVATLAACAPPAEEQAAETVTLDTDQAKAGYGIGYNLAQNLTAQLGDSIDSAALQQGIADALADLPPRVDQQAAAAAMDAVSQAQTEELAQVSQAQLAAGAAFLEANGAREGVVTTASGLQYEVITLGDGPMPVATDTVVTHYHGTLVDGTVFDSSVERGAPASFPVNGVIKGWVEALQLMPVGSKWRLFVPPSLAYGERGAGGDIGPNETLIFEVELLEIKGS